MSERKNPTSEKVKVGDDLTIRLAEPRVRLTGREALDLAERLVRVGFRAVMVDESRRAGLNISL